MASLRLTLLLVIALLATGSLMPASSAAAAQATATKQKQAHKKAGCAKRKSAAKRRACAKKACARKKPGAKKRRCVKRLSSKSARGRSTKRDIDGDGIPNKRDRDIDGNGIPNKRDRDIDGDRIANPRDRDIDGDGVKNGDCDLDIDADGARNRGDADMDADRVPNATDPDVDADGVLNGSDPDIDGDCAPNAEDRDMNGSGIPNHLDPDTDGDGIVNHLDGDSTASGTTVTKLPEQVTARVRRDFFGLIADELLWADPNERPRVTERLQETGVGTVRQLFDWSIVEKAPGVYDWGLYDAYVEHMTRSGLSILPILYHPPEFHSARPPGDTTHGTYPPRTNASLAAYATAAVRRYGPGGSFWAERPGLEQRPLRSWQIWNEANLNVYWLPSPNAAQYVQMLKAVGAAIKQVDPGAEIVTGGLPQSRAAGVDVTQYVTDMYRAGAKGSFDTFAIHPYAGAADGVYEIVNRFRELMDDEGDHDKRIWITELGWATGGPAHPFNIGTEAQAQLIKRVLGTLVAQSSQLKLRGIIYFNWRDLPLDPKTGDRWGLHTGLFRRDNSEKPSFTAFRDAVALLTG